MLMDATRPSDFLRFVGYNRPGGMTLKKKDDTCMANVSIFPKE